MIRRTDPMIYNSFNSPKIFNSFIFGSARTAAHPFLRRSQTVAPPYPFKNRG